jgi:hypothetical protein
LAVTGGGGSTVSCHTKLVLPAEFDAVIVKVVAAEAAAGVPEMTPVTGLMVNPAGNAGLTEYDATDPVTVGISGTSASSAVACTGLVYDRLDGGAIRSPESLPPPQAAKATDAMRIARTRGSCCHIEDPSLVRSDQVCTRRHPFNRGLTVDSASAAATETSIVDTGRI